MDRTTRVVLLAVGCALAFAGLWPRLAAARLPGNDEGFEPDQPIVFSHRLHAGELEVPCLYCHAGAERSRHAGVPSAGLCMNCHRSVAAPLAAIREEEKAAEEEGRPAKPVLSPEIAKLYTALGLDGKAKPDPSLTPRPVEWTRVVRVPDFVFFDHRVHIAAAVTCQRCHGPVETMERMRQDGPLSMGWCLDCHRTSAPGAGLGQAFPAEDCSACHY